MRRLVAAVLLVSGIVLAGQPAQAAAEGADFGDFVALIDPDGEPCTGVPNSLPGIFNFSSACVAHDACYVQGEDNSACDTAFRRNLLASCVSLHPKATDPLRYVCKGFALLYYTGVVIYGQLT